MSKYAKYASWLAKAIIAVAAVANFAMMTREDRCGLTRLSPVATLSS